MIGSSSNLSLSQSGKSDKNAMKKKINLYYNVEVEQDLEIKSKE
ncbi:hypothetical protein [Staphylococcus hominis]|nr:hypothetical protein [Staphylococcus hominis]MDS3909647.1 hypothetical protein [Staphylococcus hominis]